MRMREPMAVLQALAAARGFKDFANTKKIPIQRRSSNANTALRPRWLAGDA
jgi:hypothetical protein